MSAKSRDLCAWTKSEDAILKMQYNEECDIDELSNRHLRGREQITLRLLQLGVEKIYSVKSKKKFFRLMVSNSQFILKFFGS